jgi:hypothetical protein
MPGLLQTCTILHFGGHGGESGDVIGAVPDVHPRVSERTALGQAPKVSIVIGSCPYSLRIRATAGQCGARSLRVELMNTFQDSIRYQTRSALP